MTPLPGHNDSRAEAPPCSAESSQDSSNVGCRLADFRREWSAITGDLFIRGLLEHGYVLPFAERPPLARVPWKFEPPASEPKRSAFQQAIQKLLAKGAIEPVIDHSSPGFYSRLFLVPKKDGGWRPVIDLSQLNEFLEIPHFRMETAEGIMKALQRKEWAVTLDLRDAYLHIPMSRGSRKYLRFAFADRVYQFRALPFGLATAPLVFTRVAQTVVEHVHKRGIRMHAYLDDWLLRAATRRLLLRNRDFLINLCERLGLVLNFPKSNLTPSQIFIFLGIRFDLVRFECRPSEDRWKRLLAMIKRFVRSTKQTARRWLSLLGSLSSMDSQVPLGRLHRKPLNMSLMDKWRNKRLDAMVPVSPRDKLLLRWWSSRENVMCGQTLRPFKSQAVIFTDASKQGWGAHLGSMLASGVWPTHWSSYHINWLELEAVRLALLKFQDQVTGKDITVMSDNRTVVAYLNRHGGTRSRRLFALAKKILLWAIAHGVRILARHISGHLNVVADQLSRKGQVIGTEWSLHPTVAKAMWDRWGTPHLDLFATRWNHKLPVFVSPVPDPLAFAVDALAIDWRGMWAYAFPPLPLIPQVLRKIRDEQVEIILVAPWWPKKDWALDLLELSVEPPLRLPLWETLLVQPRTSRFHRNPRALNLHAWRLSHNRSGSRGSQVSWRTGSHEVGFADLL